MDELDFINRIRKRKMQSRPEQCFVAFTHRFAETQQNGALPLFDFEKSREDKHERQYSHENFDHRKTAAQGLGERLRTMVFRQQRIGAGRSGRGRLGRRMRMPVLVVVVMMIVFAHSAIWYWD